MKQQLRLLHVVGDSKYGGASVVVQRLAEAAQRDGILVDVLTTDPTFEAVLRNSGIGVINMPCIWRAVGPHDLIGLARLYHFLRRHPYTIVHTHTSKGGFVGRFAARLAGVPVIVHTVHGFAFHEQSSKPPTLVYACLERTAARWCDVIVTVSRFHRDLALRMRIGTPHKVVAIPNGIPASRVVPDQTPESVRRALGVSESEYLLLASGRLAPQKGFEFAIRAVALLKGRIGRPVRLVLAGDGPLRDRLMHLVRNLGVGKEVLFLGFRTDIANLLAAADAVVLPSLWEGLSISLLEAMAAGKPMVATAIGSNLEVLAREQVALLVPPRDAEALAGALAKLITQPSLAAELGSRARQVYESGYTEESMLERYLQLYHDLLTRKGLKLA